ncbi:MAG TPA: hypothetical protein VG965_03085 [Patescibacteria group bacterium]|nr:hypothetical protein [Patescibacteria group bacterium]
MVRYELESLKDKRYLSSLAPEEIGPHDYNSWANLINLKISQAMRYNLNSKYVYNPNGSVEGDYITIHEQNSSLAIVYFQVYKDNRFSDYAVVVQKGKAPYEVKRNIDDKWVKVEDDLNFNIGAYYSTFKSASLYSPMTHTWMPSQQAPDFSGIEEAIASGRSEVPTGLATL